MTSILLSICDLKNLNVSKQKDLNYHAVLLLKLQNSRIINSILLPLMFMTREYKLQGNSCEERNSVGWIRSGSIFWWFSVKGTQIHFILTGQRKFILSERAEGLFLNRSVQGWAPCYYIYLPPNAVCLVYAPGWLNSGGRSNLLRTKA